MPSPMIGEIRMFSGEYSPKNWLWCNGQPLLISEFQDLWSVIGTRFGSDGKDVFLLPDFRGAIPTNASEEVALGSASNVIKKGDDGPKSVTVNFIIAHKGLSPSPGNRRAER